MDIPDSIDKHVDILIPGIESEEVEEINDAYKDILEELGNEKASSSSNDNFISWGVAATTEYEMDEVMPSCCPLMLLDYIYAKCFQSKYQQPVPDWISPMS